MCNTSLSKRPDFNMKLDLFENILIKMKKLGNRVTALHTIGEPLMNKDLFKYFELLRKYKIKVFLSTNAIPLNEKNIRKLLDWTDVIYTLRFSIDGSTKDVYEKIRVNGNFDILIKGNSVQKKVWGELKKIKFGQTKSYGEIAKKYKLSPRHVGKICGQNQIILAIPCHRVIKSDGSLGGFSSIGGVNTKKKLLNFEKN